MWMFVQRDNQGKPILEAPVPDLGVTWHSHVQERTLGLGWNEDINLTAPEVLGTGQHVSAKLLTEPCPGFLWKALCDPKCPNCRIWHDSQKEEHDNLVAENMCTIITADDVATLGVKPIPTRKVLNVKIDSSRKPLRAKSRTVVLGNEEEKHWTKNESFTPVVLKSGICSLIAHGVKLGCRAKQCDAKNAFCQSTPPDDEVCVVIPPSGCPFSKPGTCWKLNKTPCGLRRSPRHWCQTFCTELEAMGLTVCSNDPCAFAGTLPTWGTICFVTHVDDCICFGTDDATEEWFEQALGSRLNVDFVGEVLWCLGVHCEWQLTEDNLLTVQLSQEGHIHKLLDQEWLIDCNPTLAPHRSGHAIDMVPHDEHTLVKRHQSLIGGLNWLSTGTRPDITMAASLLASHLKNPSQGHLDAA